MGTNCGPFLPFTNSLLIQVKGVPSHLWSKAMLLSVARNIGYFEAAEISTSSARVKVMINGLKPLIVSTTLEFFNGDEVTAELFYEKLKSWKNISSNAADYAMILKIVLRRE